MTDLDRTREHLEVLADALTLPSEGDWRFMCHLCFQALPNADARCNSGLHVGPGEGNPFNGRAVPADERVWHA